MKVGRYESVYIQLEHAPSIGFVIYGKDTSENIALIEKLGIGIKSPVFSTTDTRHYDKWARSGATEPGLSSTPNPLVC